MQALFDDIRSVTLAMLGDSFSQPRAIESLAAQCASGLAQALHAVFTAAWHTFLTGTGNL